MKVSAFQHFLGWFQEHNSHLLLTASDFETKTLQRSLSGLEIDRPLFICGLARSGTTILLELFSELPGVATHRYRDFPFVMIPFWWDRFVSKNTAKHSVPVERAHKDGIHITPESPEAMEEILWMIYFENCHNPRSPCPLAAHTRHPEFEKTYIDSIKKLLFARNAQRYVTKNNYNIARISYLISLFPDAKFCIPVRDPVWHIASLIKQHRLLSKEHKKDKRSLAYMQRSGHFEFGLDRRAMNMGNTEVTDKIETLWKHGEDIEAWALYWNDVHEFLLEKLERGSQLANQVSIVDYDKLCAKPSDALAKLYQRMDFDVADELIAAQSQRLRTPAYYQPKFNDQEIELIKQITGASHSKLCQWSQAQAGQ